MWTCKPQNRVPGGGVKSGGKLTRYLCLLGSRARVAPAWNILRGGDVPRISVCLFHGSFFYLSSMQLLGSAVDRTSAGRTRRNERDDSDSDPPFFAAGAARKWGGHVPVPCSKPCTPPFQGSLPSNLSLREGFGQHKPLAGAKLAGGKPHEMALSGPHLWRDLLLRLGFHLAAFSHARRRSNAPPGALSHPQLLRLDCSLVLHGAGRRSHRRRAVSYLGLAGLV